MISPLSMQMYKEKDDWIRHYKNEIKWRDAESVEPMARVNELYQRGYFNEGGLTLGGGEGLQLVKKRRSGHAGDVLGHQSERDLRCYG